ncbi:Mucin-associated surface protein (MASP) [Trypanosoma cruzi]|uniref:Mucin-associated surface protein (MASP) n=1 Tax=Trypanosoma cruzi TaxID=5693 RepID=A0A2V2VBB3_TRYCR|nr:Mucin-associated surface protein (MASP) [Trypanosoma cruzi]
MWLLCDLSLLLLSLCVDVLLVCAEGYTQVTGVMAMIMTGRVLLVCALCVLWCVAGGVYARDVDTNALGGCMVSGVLGENGSHMPDGCNKTAITVPLRSVLPITAVAASTGKGGSVEAPNNSHSSETSNAGVTGSGSAAGPGPAGGSGASSGAGAPAAGSGEGEAGSPGSNPSKTTGDSQTGDQTPAAAAAHNTSPAKIPAEKTSGTGHKGQEEEEEEEEEDHEKQQQSDEAQVQQHQQHEHPAENGEESAKDKNALRTNATANTGDSDGSTAVSHTTSPLFLLLVVACAAAAAVVAA